MGTAGQSITLANSIIGVGILAMPFCFQQCGIVLATLTLLSMGLVSRLCCYFLLKSALLARRRNFEFLAFHVFGPAGKLAVEIGIIGFLMGSCIAYFVVVGDLGPQIISKLLNINQSDFLRTSIMVLVSLVCVLPLGLLRNVDSLSNVSAATIGFYFCLVTKVIAEAASQLLTGEWRVRVEMWKPSGLLQCVPILSMALFCQTQLFEIFESLPTLSLEKMNLVTKNAINICTGVYLTLGVFGYIAFSSQQISGNILMSLSPTMASDVIKLGFVMSVAFSFPLIIFPCRASLYSLLYKKVHSSHHDHIIHHSIPESSFRCITVAIIAVTLFISLLIPNIELVLGLVGSTIGVLICVVFPAACFVNVTFKNTNERVLAKGILIFGLVIMVLGTYANLQAAESQIDKYDEKYITQERIDKIVEDFFEKMDKSDGVIAKPVAENNVPDNKKKKDDGEMKDSVILPPNPVPPELQSNEKEKSKVEEIKVDSNIKEVLEKPANNMLDKVSESHPKNLNKINDAKLTNGDINVQKSKIDKPVDDKTKLASAEEKMNMMKQQKLMETIKQHGKEQKELIKEQKQILDEILKTKKELQNNKKEVDSIDAKKIAVESIKKIADMAIQSLGGASEKPDVDGKKSENVEKMADGAVQEIAKKAVETIEAINEINVKDVKTNSDKQAQVSIDPNAQSNLLKPAPNKEVKSNNINPNPKEPVENANNLNAIPPIAQNINQLHEINSNPAQSANNQQQPSPNVLQPSEIVQKPINDQMPIANIQQPSHDLNPSKNVQQPLVNEQAGNPQSNPNQNVNAAQKAPNDLQNQPKLKENIEAQNNLIQNAQKPISKKHSHSPDEPQSYKQGEDTRIKQIETNNVKNVPNVPLVSKETNKNTNEKVAQAPKSSANDINKVQNDAINNLHPNIEQVLARQKREVVDCTEKTSLKPEDKQICENLVNSPKYMENSKEVLPKIDLSDMGLPRNLPMDANLIHHLSRSLKTYDVKDKER